MLSERERQVLQELERSLADEPDRPGLSTPPPQRRQGRPAAIRAATIGCALLGLLFVTGAIVAALAIGAAGVLGWLLWHYWSALRDDGTAPVRMPAGPGSGASPRRVGGAWQSRYLRWIQGLE
ncbi:DUF3040 domain-containing protein [Modestobacter marinus]|uniref:DUF3040 domain-containing protein n=1 Tax=Modestobacter marinus TaxID=477641 RepID=UPI001C964928|nr:DUF3040 domain-containing protein [Modestobacter marinus]